MKNKILGILFSLSLFIITGCSLSPNRALIKKCNDLLNINIKGDYEIENVFDTHGGFHNDGRSIDAIKFNDEGLNSSLSLNSSWVESPFTSDIDDILYGDLDRLGIFSYNEENVIPKITDGYYSFYDTFKNGLNNLVDSNNLPYNFILGVYDNNTKTLYICEFDS